MAISRPEIVEDMHLKFLDNLRETGETNMYCSVPYLQAAFAIHKRDAEIILLYWMESFSERFPDSTT